MVRFGLFSLIAPRPTRRKRPPDALASKENAYDGGWFESCSDFDIGKWSACSFDITAFLGSIGSDHGGGGAGHVILNKSKHTINTNGTLPTPPTTASSVRQHKSVVTFDFDPDAIRERLSNETDEGKDGTSGEVGDDADDGSAVVETKGAVVMEDRVVHEVIPNIVPQLGKGKTLTQTKGLKKLAKPNPHTEYVVLCYNRKRIERHLDFFCPPTDRGPTISKKVKRPTTRKISNMSSRKLAMKSNEPDDNEEEEEEEEEKRSSSTSHINLNFDTVIPIAQLTQQSQPQPIPVTLTPQSSTNSMMEQHQPNQHIRQKPCPNLHISTASTKPSSQPQPTHVILRPQSSTNSMVEQHQPNQHLQRKPSPEPHISTTSLNQPSKPQPEILVPQSNANCIVEQHQQNKHLLQKKYPKPSIFTSPHMPIPTPTLTTSAETQSFLATTGAFSLETTSTSQEKNQDEIIPTIAQHMQGKPSSTEMLHSSYREQWRRIRSLADDMLEGVGTKESFDKVLEARHNAVSPVFLDQADETDYRENPDNWCKVESPAFYDPGEIIDYLQKFNSFQQETNSDGSKAVFPETNSDKSKVEFPVSSDPGDEIDYPKNSGSLQHDTNGDMGNVVFPLETRMPYNGHAVTNWKDEQEDSKKFNKDLNSNTLHDSISVHSMDQNELTPSLRLEKYPDDIYDYNVSYLKSFSTVTEDQTSQTHPHHTEINNNHGLSYEPLEFSMYLKDQPSKSFHRTNDNANNIAYTPDKVAILLKLPRFVDGNDATSVTTSITLHQPSIHTMQSLRAAETISSSYSSIENPNIISLKTRVDQIRGRIEEHLSDIRVRNDIHFHSSASASASASPFKNDDIRKGLSSMSSEKEDDDDREGVYADLPNLMDSIRTSYDNVTDSDADQRHSQMITKPKDYKPMSPTGVDAFDCKIAVEKANQLKRSSFFNSEVAGVGERASTRLFSDVGRTDISASEVAVLATCDYQTKNLSADQGTTTCAKITDIKRKHCVNVENSYIFQLKARLRQIELKVQNGRICA